MNTIEEKMELCSSCNKHTLQRRNIKKFGAFDWVAFILLLIITIPFASFGWPVIILIAGVGAAYNSSKSRVWICSECKKRV